MLTSLKSLDHDELLSLAESSNSMDTLIDIVEFSILHGDNELVRKVVANPHMTHDLFHHTISIGYAYRNAFAHGSQDEYILHHLIDIGVHSNCFVTNPYIPLSVAKRVANTERDIEKVGMYTKNCQLPQPQGVRLAQSPKGRASWMVDLHPALHQLTG